MTSMSEQTQPDDGTRPVTEQSAGRTVQELVPLPEKTPHGDTTAGG